MKEKEVNLDINVTLTRIESDTRKVIDTIETHNNNCNYWVRISK